MDPLDYAGHYLEVKKNLTKAHDLLNKKQFREAASLIDEMIVELRLMRQAVKTHIKD